MQMSWVPAGVDPARGCLIAPTVEMIFSRWTTPILWALHQDGTLRFGELQERAGTVTAKVLTQRLRQLERDGLVERTYHPEMPPRVEYTITDLGRSLQPVFAALGTWTRERLPEVEKSRQAYAGPLPR